VAIGDVDGDRKPDIVVANLASNTISVLLGKGGGTFGARIDYGVGFAPRSVAMADLNRDGKLDLVAANSKVAVNTVSVLLNTGHDIPTPTILALVDATADPHHVELSWYGASLAGGSATVYRRAGETAWTAVASIASDGTGRFMFEDVDVRPGARYGYRLGIRVGGVEAFYGETSITVPDEWVLGLAAPVPNPAGDRLAITLTLPSDAPARLEVIDIAGRVVALRDGRSLGAGRHVVAFAEAARWRSGIYLLRLTQGARSVTARACIVR
jgi:hypothetical protein